MIRSLANITINKIIHLILIILLTEKCDNIIKIIYWLLLFLDNMLNERRLPLIGAGFVGYQGSELHWLERRPPC